MVFKKFIRIFTHNYLFKIMVEKFIKLQEKINQQIDQNGEADLDLVNELEKISNSLSPQEEDEIINWFINK